MLDDHVKQSSYLLSRAVSLLPGPFYTAGNCLACDAPEHEAPDLLAPLIGCNGSRIGLVWETGASAAKWVYPIGDEGPGLYEVTFPKPVKNLHDLIECFRSVVPQLQIIGKNRPSTRLWRV